MWERKKILDVAGNMGTEKLDKKTDGKRAEENAKRKS